MILSNYIFNWISFSPLLHHRSHLPSFITFMTHHLFCLKRFNKLNGVDEFPSELWYTTKLLVGSLDGLDLRTNEDVELGFHDKNWHVMLYSSYYHDVPMMGLYIEILMFFTRYLDWLVFGFQLGANVGYEMDFWYGRVIGTILFAVYGLPIGTCEGRVKWSLEGFIYGAVDGECLCLCCCIGYVHIIN